MEVKGPGGDTLDGIVVIWAKGMFCEPQLHHQLQVCPVQALRQLGTVSMQVLHYIYHSIIPLLHGCM